MNQSLLIWLILASCLVSSVSYCQDQPAPSMTDRIINFPGKLFSHIQHKTADLDQQLTRQTEACLQKMSKREERLRKRLYKVDSTAAKRLFANSSRQYAALSQKIRTDTGSRNMSLQGEYQPNLDSLRNTLSFLQQHPQLLSSPGTANFNPGTITPGAGLPGSTLPAQVLPLQPPAQLQGAVSQLQTLQAHMQDADEVKQYIRDRKEQIGQYLSQHANLSGLMGKDFQGMNQSLYYYSQEVRAYKEMLNSPDAMISKAMSLLNQLPVFQTFLKSNSQLAAFFNLPGNYGSAQGVVGLQTRDQIGQLIQSQVSSAGAGGGAALQSNLQSAESQLNTYKDKLSQLGPGSGDIDMPNFKPNEQKTKTFWKRLEYGANFQTTRNTSFFPTVTDLGLSVGYNLGHSNMIGLGASYKIGWGSGFNHIAFSSQGLSFRSFVEVRLIKSFFISGGMEYNYTTPITSFQQIDHLSYWTPSGLIGLTKVVSVKSRVFKKTKLSLLWDFLSYQQVPKTQPLLFRIGYGF
jgi:hypothetical protein